MSPIRRATTAEDAIEAFDRDGLVVVEGVLSDAEVASVKQAVRQAVADDRSDGTRQHGFAFDPDDRNVRIFNLCGRDRIFRALVEHPIAVRLATHALGPGFILSNFSGNITGPGSGPMGMHADAGYAPEPWARASLGINVAWAIDDFTDAVGATRVVPGSYWFERNPRPEDSQAGIGRGTIPIECKAGSIFIMDGKVWHQTGPNTSANTPRIGLFAYYVRPFVKPQYDWTKAIDADDLEDASPLLRYMLGFTDVAVMTGVALPYPPAPGRARNTPLGGADAR